MRVVYEPDTWEMRGERYRYTHIAFVDVESGERFTTTESDTVCYNQVANQYRKRHGIPYTDEMISLRSRYGLSAAKMSEVLGFGTNQWRLYEAGELPNENNGKMIRSAMNPKVILDIVEYSREQFREKEYDKLIAKIQAVIARRSEFHREADDVARVYTFGRGEANGYAPQSISRLHSLLLHILKQFGNAYKTQLNKLLFYIDFLAYRESGMAISSLSYKAIEFGPVPHRYERVYSEFDDVEQRPQMIHDYEGTILVANANADLSLFDEKERQIIDMVCDFFKGYTARRMSEISHREPLWMNHKDVCEQIPFTEAFSLVAL